MALKLVQSLIRLEEGLLNRVLGVFGIVRNVQGNAQQLAIVSPDKFFVAGDIAVPGCLNECESSSSTSIFSNCGGHEAVCCCFQREDPSNVATLE